VNTSRLDSEPGILWAGGIPWDLAASAREPVPAREDDGEPWNLCWPHMLSANYRPDITVATPVWDKATTAVFPDAAEREHALDAFAHGLHGWPSDACPLGRSGTGTGKSWLASLMSDMLGDYAGQVSAATLFGRSGSDQFAFDEMGGARFVVMDEGTRGDFASTERFKRVVNPNPLVSARGRHERRHRLAPYRATLLLTVNPEADLDYSDSGVVRRLIPLGYTGDPAQIKAISAVYGTRTPEGLVNWRAEAPGVLAKMITRCARVLADPAYRGTREDAPASVIARFDAVVAGADPFTAWAGERLCEGWFTANDELYADYESWCAAYGKRPLNDTWFGRKMASRRVEPVKPDRGTRGWRIALR
jgi:phage/plasmid-associated DNA primase